VLRAELENVQALSNLSRILLLSRRPAEAHALAERLKAVDSDRADVGLKKAEALSYLGDDQGVLDAFAADQRLLAEAGSDELTDPTLFHLAAVAHLPLGHEVEARRLWERALQKAPGHTLAALNLDDLHAPVGERHAPWPFSFGNWLSRQTIGDLAATVQTAAERGNEEAVRRGLRRFLRQHPEVAALVPLLLDRGDLEAREFALRVASLLRTPELLAALREFALGQRGPDAMRQEAAQVAREAGLMPTGLVRFWSQGEWRDVMMLTFEISEEPLHRHPPRVEAWHAEALEALRAGDAERAEGLLQQALAVLPDDPSLLNNLGSAYEMLGRGDEARAMLRRLFEEHPDYFFARIGIARLAIHERQFAQARELLQPLMEQGRYHISESTRCATPTPSCTSPKAAATGRARGWICGLASTPNTRGRSVASQPERARLAAAPLRLAAQPSYRLAAPRPPRPWLSAEPAAPIIAPIRCPPRSARCDRPRGGLESEAPMSGTGKGPRRRIVALLATLALLGVVGCAPTGSPTRAPNAGGSGPPPPPNAGGSPTTRSAAEAADAPQGSGSGSGSGVSAAARPGHPDTAPAAPIKVRIGSTAVAAALALPWLARDTGLYEQNGLDAEIISVGTGPLAVQAMIAGELDLAYNTAPSLVTANLGGADVVMLAGGVNTMIFSLVAGSGVDRIEDLRGKRLGITRLGTSSDFNARYVLKRYGLEPDADVAMIQMSGIPEILTGLVAGAVDAGMMSHPTLVNAKQQGYHVVLDLGKLGLEYQHNGVMSTRHYVDAHPDAVRRVLKAHVEAIHRFKTDKAAAIDSLSRFTQITDPAILEETWQAYAGTYFEQVPYATVPGLQVDIDGLVATVPAAAGVRAESYVDNRFMDELLRGGLIQQLYGS
jgi:ABC-type nitrate/sulfonate/bicarbonate transport system substrate-binding protein/tetratricopeptide (TPR) repeat protein